MNAADGTTAAGTAVSPPPRGFAASLFGRVPREDLSRLTPQILARLAQEAWDHVRQPRRGRHSLRVFNPDLPGLKEPITIVEAVNDDMPFLVDSIIGALTEAGFEARLLAHPVLDVVRDSPDAAAKGLGEGADSHRESLIHIHLDEIRSEETRARLAAEIDRTLADVRLATEHFRAMKSRLQAAIVDLKEFPPQLPAEDIAEAVAFLEWLGAENFVFIGSRECRYEAVDEDTDSLETVDGTGLGILRDPSVMVLRRGRELVAITPEIREFLHEPAPLIVTKASLRSRVHRRAHLDYVGVKLFDKDGKLTGELRFVGLFTGSAYTRPAATIPLLRRRIAIAFERSGFAPDSHSGRALRNVLEDLPRDELFQLDADHVYTYAMRVLEVYERPHPCALARVDRFDRFVSVLAFIPRDKFDSVVRERIGRFLAEIYDGRQVAFEPVFIGGVPLTRVHYIIGRYEGRTPNVEQADLDAGIAERVQTWDDRLRRLLDRSEESLPEEVWRYRDALTAGYRESVSPERAWRDLQQIRRLTDERPFAIDFERRTGDPETRVALRILSRGRSLSLAERVPLLDHMGFRAINERTFRILPEGISKSGGVWVHDMTLERTAGGPIALADIDEALEDLFMAVARGEAESDGFNALGVEARLNWRQIALLRAIAHFLRQAGIAFTPDYLWSVVVAHADIAADVVELFAARFDPKQEKDREARESAVRERIEAALADVASLDEDRILRRFVNAVEATLRTNFYQPDESGNPKGEISFKFDSRKLDELPPPHPLVEIFVYSPRYEGVHLRFGKVARGGLRWSDRPQDFRTEVLGLVKAQQVKNAVIVPVGAKGGFVPKRLPPSTDRDAFAREGREVYECFISALLDLTDNLEGEEVVPPAHVVRHDGDDPYLVVAADKGTATFSDTANAVALKRGFWLGDAFASGGSAGYDHKEMGITARGAWEAVKRHFREMDHDMQSEPFTVAGVGDMSGDVFGNAMLQSRAIRLVAAFDHRHIFLDPDPDPEISWAERKRLFDLPRSSWDDYDKAVLSKGGGVFPRTLKSVPLSPQIQALLHVTADHMAPPDLIRAILRADTDLLFFGGIGTYVRASDQGNDEAGDRSNDAVRITAAEIGAKVIGEGANLGMTQRGRIEAARHGVRLNTDAIDNSAGVNTSDMEVNIKIALSLPVADGRLSEEDRDSLLVDMTDEVAALVLANNYRQTLALSLAERRGLEDLGFEQRLMHELEAKGELDRAVEFLPDDRALAERTRNEQPLTRPELAVLLAYAKLALGDALLASNALEESYFSRELQHYFPPELVERFPDALANHRLRKEIIATLLANAMIDLGGPSFMPRTGRHEGDAGLLAKAFTLVSDSLRIGDFVRRVDSLDTRIPSALQMELYASLQELLLTRVSWTLANVDLTAPMETLVARFRTSTDAMVAGLDRTLPQDAQERLLARREELETAGIPEEDAARLALIPVLYGAPDSALIAEEAGCGAAEALGSLAAAANWLGLGRLRETVKALPVNDYYERRALDRAVAQIGGAERALAIAAARRGGGEAGMEAWVADHPQALDVRAEIAEMARSGMSFAKLAVAGALLADLTRE